MAPSRTACRAWAACRRHVTDWIEDPGKLRKLKVRFAAPARPGDTVTFKGKVTDKKEEDGKKLVVLEVGAETQDGVRY